MLSKNLKNDLSKGQVIVYQNKVARFKSKEYRKFIDDIKSRIRAAGLKPLYRLMLN